MSTFAFHQVDVFTDTPYYGNPVAVVNCLDASKSAPSQEQMLRFANWTNLSETTFLLPPSPGSEADYRLKIFTPAYELPFAGHPTLGSCYSFLKHLGQEASEKLIRARDGKIVQDCGVGNVELKVSSDDGSISFVAPDFLRYGPVDEKTLSRICTCFELDRKEILDSHWIVNGPEWIGIKLKDAQSVLQLKPKDSNSIKDLLFGFIGPYPHTKNAEGETVAHEVRAFVFEDIGEDPVTGSLNAGFAKWLELTGDSPATAYVNSQGTALGRKGRVTIKVDHSNKDSTGQPKIWVGGKCALCIEGQVHF